ncbi:Aldos-2-ulose dehydratase [Mycena venus]|uniref:Aldos-2-ulose dehydratase n=1 Tax=Mycena venus TaxID=2733690 RepID=A0A8H6Y9K8_9AGAR|nr:Aldos-2-ulose dehydratase [Mycena venus]
MPLSAQSNLDIRKSDEKEVVVATPLPDGYWLQAFHFQKSSAFPDLIGYGLGFAEKPAAIKLFINPTNSGSSGWKVTEIQSLDFPVGMTYADLTGDGYNDIIICDRYGPGMTDLWDAQTKDGGRIQWLRNPGNSTEVRSWTAHHIGNSTGMHRQVPIIASVALLVILSDVSVAGHFTDSAHTQVIGFPVISASNDLSSPAPVILYTPAYGSDPSKGPNSWSYAIIFPSQFRLIHDVKVLPETNGTLDMILVAGKEGIVLLWFNRSNQKWEYRIVGTGIPQASGLRFWGSGSFDIVRLGDDPVGYIATCEAFHGNIVCVYTKPQNSTKGAASLKENIWTRHVIDDFGPLSAVEQTGTIHHVAAINLPTGAGDSFAIACMGGT